MLKYIASFLIAVLIAAPAFSADLPCGQVRANKSVSVIVRLNADDPAGSVSFIRVLTGNVSGTYNASVPVYLPTPNADGTYTLHVGGLLNTKDYYFAAVAVGPFGESPRTVESPDVVLADISGTCPAPGVPELLSVVVD